MRIVSAAVIVVAFVACTREPAPPQPITSVPIDSLNAKPVFLHDDFEAALTSARAAGAVVFVDAWAPWCHTCLSMQRDVFEKTSLGVFSSKVVFLAIDTDKPINATFIERYPVSLWPTFFVLDPNKKEPIAVHPGAMDEQGTIAFIKGALERRDNRDDVDDALDAAYAASAAGNIDDAVAAFDAAMARSAARDARRQEIVTRAAWARAKQTAQPEVCVAFIEAHAAELSGGPAGDVLGALARCAANIKDDAKKKAAMERTKARLQALVDKPAAGASIDDRADVMATLAELFDDAGARALHEQRLAMLEADARTASDERGQQVHDYARMNSLLFLGRGDDAATLLQARAKALPDDYEPAARLASVLFRLQRYDEAKAAVERAIALSYGPRRLRYVTLLADIEEARGDVAARDAALTRVVSDNDALPAPLKLASVTEAAKARLGK